MQHEDDLISISAAAKEIGVNRSTLSRQVADGAVRSHGGKVRLSEVLEDRIANIDLARSRRREGEADDDVGVASGRVRVASAADATADSDGDATEAEDGLPVIVDGQTLAYKDARALKETYLARLRQLEFQIKSGEFVSIDEVVKTVAGEYSIVRNRLLTVPGKMAPRLVNRSMHEIEAALMTEIVAVLEELHDPDRRP